MAGANKLIDKGEQDDLFNAFDLSACINSTSSSL